MTPLCCHQMLPPTTSGRTTARGDRNNNKSGGGGVGQTPPEADPRSKEATSGWERETLSKADGKRYRNRRNDHRHCSGRATWRLTEHGNQCSSGSRGSEAGPRDDARSGEHRDSQPRRHGGEHSQRQPNRVAPEIEGRRRHRDPSSATSSCQRERSKTKHRWKPLRFSVSILCVRVAGRRGTMRDFLSLTPSRRYFLAQDVARGFQRMHVLCFSGYPGRERSTWKWCVLSARLLI